MNSTRWRVVVVMCVALPLSAPGGGTLLGAQQLSDSDDGMTPLHWAAVRGDVAATAGAAVSWRRATAQHDERWRPHFWWDLWWGSS